jgi:hypothetical protein
MKIITGLIGYAVGVAALAAGLVYGMFWLVQPGTSAASTPRVAPIPPRIAESIERKKEPPPPPSALVPVRELMKESNVSLVPPQKQTIRELSANSPVRTPRQRTMEARGTAIQPQAMPAIPVVRTTRSDVPF